MMIKRRRNRRSLRGASGLRGMRDYENIKKIADRLQPKGYLQSYRTDLTKHDLEALKDHDGPFLWAIRENGTHILTPDGACYGTNHGPAWADMKRTFGDKVKTYYASRSGQTPKAVSTSEAGQIARRWEKQCKVRLDPWTGKPMSKGGSRFV